MDLTVIGKRLGISDKQLIRKAAEIRRLCDLRFFSSAIGMGEVCKAIICLEIAANRSEIMFDRPNAVKLSGVSEKAYNRCFNCMQNIIGVENTLDVRELGIQFGCIRLIPFVKKGLSTYKERFVASLPASRRATADITRPVFTAVAFYLSAKKHKLKIDKLKFIEVCGTSEREFTCVSNSMMDLSFDVFGIEKEKKDHREIKGNQDLLDKPEKRSLDEGAYISHDEPESLCYKKLKRMETNICEQWKSSVLQSNKNRGKVSCKRAKKTKIDFLKKALETQEMEAATQGQ
ncbi:hypothetical protein SAY86_008890 [Trapa natans]|uniref:Origin recognition complex subunit 6 n=1 Tax=Trapa natans TaxID=22666 RepID=A0AAN7KB92_TRANT|nr:hypothetical protein SAY86_008890 [Trapa natans]